MATYGEKLPLALSKGEDGGTLALCPWLPHALSLQPEVIIVTIEPPPVVTFPGSNRKPPGPDRK
jgi:hypothetical protein